MADVAASAGVSQGLPYRYFRDKDDPASARAANAGSRGHTTTAARRYHRSSVFPMDLQASGGPGMYLAPQADLWRWRRCR